MYGGLLALGLVAGACVMDNPNDLVGNQPPPSLATSSGSVGHGGSSTMNGTTASVSGSGTMSGSGAGDAGMGVGGADAADAGTGGFGGNAALLNSQVVNYTEALRSASFKLVGDAPTLQNIILLQSATDQKSTYESMIDAMFADPRFAARMVEFWQNAFHMRQEPAGAAGCSTATPCPQTPSRDEAPVFAARLTFENGSFADLLTQTDATKTCPTYDAAQAVATGDPTKVFSDGTGCSNTASLAAAGGPGTVGILTDPGVMALYFGNFAFRRNRFFHETFICRSAVSPAAEPIVPPEVPGPNCPVSGYGSPWDLFSITGDTDKYGAGCTAANPCVGNLAAIDFQQAQQNGTICANCHATWNHRAPLWSQFDVNGLFTAMISVPSSAGGLATLDNWLPQGEPTAWKIGVPTPTLAALGAAIAADPEVQACAVARMWNFAMSRGDIVETGNSVSSTVTGYTPGQAVAPGSLVAQFQASNFQIQTLMKTIFKGPDFVRF